MKAYLLISGTIFALLSLFHVYQLVAHWQSNLSDIGFSIAVVAIVLVSAALSFWAFRLMRAVGSVRA
jgi:hypothetical protein